MGHSLIGQRDCCQCQDWTLPSILAIVSGEGGGASHLYGIGGTTLMVQVLGDWRSQIFMRYLYLSTEDRHAAQELIKNNINSTVGDTKIPAVPDQL